MESLHRFRNTVSGGPVVWSIGRGSGPRGLVPSWVQIPPPALGLRVSAAEFKSFSMFNFVW